MSVALNNYTYPYLLWHGTAEGNVGSILDQGLRPRGPRRGYQRQRPVWFYNSAEPYLDVIKSNDRPEESRGMVCAVEWSSFELGVDFSYESPQVVTVYRAIPAEFILGTFPCTEVADLGCLAQFLHSFLGPNWKDDFAARCTNPELEWAQQTSLAWTLLTLAPEVYGSSGLPGRMLSGSLETISNGTGLADLLEKTDERFRQRVNLAYYATYEFPHLARALFVALEKCGMTAALAALLSGRGSSPGGPEEALAAEVIRALGNEDIAFGIWELLSARRVRVHESERDDLIQWLVDHSDDAAKWATYFVRFAFSNFGARVGETSIGIAGKVLKATGEDHFAELLPLSGSDYPPTQLGLTSIFGVLKEERGIPYLEGRLSHEDKEHRACAVRALGRIGTAPALSLVSKVSTDPATRVRKVVEAVLSRA